MKLRERILIVDDEPKICSILSALLTRAGHEVHVVHSGEEALEIFQTYSPAVLLLDLKLPGMNGMEILARLHDEEKSGDIKVVMMTAHGQVRSAVQAMKIGAFDYLQKPFDNDELLTVIDRALEVWGLSRRVRQLEEQLEQTYGFDNLVGVSDKMQSIFALMHKYAVADGTVLVIGESGTGKELVVRAIHQASSRKKGPFVVVNCGAIPDSLIESEFFGHEAGTFTDAKKAKPGKFEAAHGGTLFLDEIGDLPLDAQVKLLRVLEQGEFTRLGSNQPLTVDVRVMAATNQDLGAKVEAGTFRQDLYWRLNVLSLHLCPLRERREDILLLTQHFVERFAPALGKRRVAVSSETQRALLNYDWPGNVRELQNVIYSALAVMEGQTFVLDDLPPHIHATSDQIDSAPVTISHQSLADMAAEAMAQTEKQAIQAALEATAGNKEKAAQRLGIGRKTLYRKLKQYGMG